MKSISSIDITYIKSVFFNSPTEILMNVESREGDIKIIFSGAILIKF